MHEVHNPPLNYSLPLTSIHPTSRLPGHAAPILPIPLHSSASYTCLDNSYLGFRYSSAQAIARLPVHRVSPLSFWSNPSHIATRLPFRLQATHLSTSASFRTTTRLPARSHPSGSLGPRAVIISVNTGSPPSNLPTLSLSYGKLDVKRVYP